MFNNKQESAKIPTTSGSHSLNSLVSGTLVEGTIRSDNDIRIDGIIKGKLYCKAKVIVGPTGQIDGEIHCENAMIEGKFEGLLKVSELLNIRETAVIEGEVYTKKLMIAAGAIFNVTCNMGSSKSKENKAGSKSEKNIEEEVRS
jgi:cytoskeletal protein CcmA (bactofilin family)